LRVLPLLERVLNRESGRGLPPIGLPDDELARREVRIVFARVSPYLRSDMDRHHITAAAGEKWIFTTLHEAIAAVRDDAFGPHVK